MEKKINILGLGPGNKKYILPITLEIIEESEILIGGKRNIESLGELVKNKEIRYIDRYLDDLIIYIKENKNKKISLIVSGDTGFYSMVPFMKKYFKISELNIIPGISSMQYFFARIGFSYESAFIGSVHGRECDFITPLKNGKIAGLLTDNKMTPQVIGEKLMKNNINANIFVGENLSYENEKVTKFTSKEIIEEKNKFEINVTIIVPNVEV